MRLTKPTCLLLLVSLAACSNHRGTTPADFIYDKKRDKCFQVQPDTSLREIPCTAKIRKEGAGAQVGWVESNRN